MHYSLPTLVFALLATLTAAVPVHPDTATTHTSTPHTTIPHTFRPPANYRPGRGPIPHHIIPPLSARDDRSAAAMIFKFENLRGPSTFIPANDYCTDMTNIFGGFDGEVRSLSTEKGVKCDFYQ
ncbi:hypothetical protein E8E13_001215 [Curvularia kusanoi]|uniref:Uncharacterized protein n=1 Tax=Curvularia kusanoi TaxID=90978 RepID=A0A9P4T829_CURKU|nr:hypothetical protein E8E13_001215 [Curvularia kusanoi]